MRQGVTQQGDGQGTEVFQRWGRGDRETPQGMVVQPTLGAIAARCQRPFVKSPPTTLIVRCNEGQYAWEEAAVLATLGILESPDISTPPGGAGAFHRDTAARPAERAMEEERLMVAIRDHDVRRVVLVNHEGCRYYAVRFREMHPQELRLRQLMDLVEVAVRLRRMLPPIQRVDCLYACVESERLLLRHVEVEETSLSSS